METCSCGSLRVVAVVGLRVRLAADPEETKIKKSECRAQCPLVRHSGQLQIPGDRAPRCGQPAGDLQHPVVLQSITLHPPLLVVGTAADRRRRCRLPAGARWERGRSIPAPTPAG